MFTGLGLFTNKFGFAALVKYYGIPYLAVNHWLVMITYLQVCLFVNSLQTL